MLTLQNVKFEMSEYSNTTAFCCLVGVREIGDVHISNRLMTFTIKVSRYNKE